MAPRSKKGSTKSTAPSKAKATKKRALPEEEVIVTAVSSTAVTGKKPSKRLRFSTAVEADVEALYKAIIASKPEIKINEDGEEEEVGGPTAKLNIPIPRANANGGLGLDDDEDEDEEGDTYRTLTLSTFPRPYCGGLIEIAIADVKEQSQEDLNSEISTPDLGRPTDGAWDAPGISATLEIQDYNLVSMIPEMSGKLCMRPLWKGVGEDGKVAELFEGRFTFRCFFARVWWKRGGKGRDEDVVFWAVRGKA